MTIADTDVLIDFLESQGLWERVRFEIDEGDLATTSVTRVELLSGARSPRKLQSSRRLLDGLTTLPLDAFAADRAAAVRRDLESRGESIGMADSLIAGIVLENGGRLLTRNRRHFVRVNGLEFAD